MTLTAHAVPAASPVPAQVQAAQRRLRLIDLVVCAVYASFAALLVSGLWPDPGGRLLVLNPDDQILDEWFLAYATQIWSGDFSLVSDRLNAPDGVNLLANATFLIPAVLLSPITLWFGAPVSFALLVGVNLAGTAIAWYLLYTRTLHLHRTAAAVAAAFCGFAPGMVSQSISHLHITAQWLLPAIVWCVITMALATQKDQQRRVAALGLGLGLLVSAQVFIGEETLLLAVFALGFVALAYAGLTRPPRQQVRTFASGLLIAAGTALMLLSYPLWLQFFGPQSVSDGAFSPDYFRADLASMVAYSPLSLAGDESAAALTTGPSEYNTFFGWPLILLALGVTLWLRRDPRVVACSVAAIAMLALSLGPEIKVDEADTGWPGPYALLQWLPIVDGALPMRFALAAIPLLGTLVGFALYHAAIEINRALQIGVPLLVGVALIPLLPQPLPTMERPPLPRYYSEGHWRQCADNARIGVPVILPVPPATPRDPEPMQFATVANTGFGMPEGFFIGPYAAGGRASLGTWKRPTSALVAEVAKTGQIPEVDADMREQTRQDLATWGVTCVVLTPHRHQEQLQRTLVELLGEGTRVADATVWQTT